MSSTLLFALGGGLLVLSGVAGLAAFVLLRRKRKKLEEQIYSDYNWPAGV